MNEDEKHAYNFLISLNLGKLDQEPLGKSTFPDFVTQDNTAIEIRRLNNQYLVNDDFEGLPEVHKNDATRIVTDELSTYDFLIPNSISVSLRIRRPFNLEKNAKRKFKKLLKERIEKATLDKTFKESIQIVDGISITLFEGNSRLNNAYELNLMHDFDLGGDVTKNRYNALNIAVIEKNNKIDSVRDKFDRFWLVLVDHIFSRVDINSVIDLHRMPKIESDFERIILLQKRDITQWQDLLPWKSS